MLSKIRNKDSLLRIAINSNTLSLSLRPRLKPYKKNVGILFPYKRPIPLLKNLYYKKIIKLLNKINYQEEEVILFFKKGRTFSITFEELVLFGIIFSPAALFCLNPSPATSASLFEFE